MNDIDAIVLGKIPVYGRFLHIGDKLYFDHVHNHHIHKRIVAIADHTVSKIKIFNKFEEVALFEKKNLQKIIYENDVLKKLKSKIQFQLTWKQILFGHLDPK